MSSESGLPAIPAKRYFTIGEVADLCGVKPHVLRYWEQEFTQLRPMKRRGNRRYYQHHEVLMIRRIRDLLYDQGFTISGARNKLQEFAQLERGRRRRDPPDQPVAEGAGPAQAAVDAEGDEMPRPAEAASPQATPGQQRARAVGRGTHAPADLDALRQALIDIRDLLDGTLD